MSIQRSLRINDRKIKSQLQSLPNMSSLRRSLIDRKIAQVLIAHRENLTTLIEVKGGKARILPVWNARTISLGQGVSEVAGKGRKKETEQQITLSGDVTQARYERVVSRTNYFGLLSIFDSWLLRALLR